jgi:hypothetical protein
MVREGWVRREGGAGGGGNEAAGTPSAGPAGVHNG